MSGYGRNAAMLKAIGQPSPPTPDAEWENNVKTSCIDAISLNANPLEPIVSMDMRE